MRFPARAASTRALQVTSFSRQLSLLAPVRTHTSLTSLPPASPTMPSASRGRVSATPTNAVTIPTDAETVELEIALLRGLLRARCVGSAKDAIMLGTHHYVSHALSRPVSVEDLWAHLRTMYDTAELDAMVRRSATWEAP